MEGRMEKGINGWLHGQQGRKEDKTTRGFERYAGREADKKAEERRLGVREGKGGW